MENIFNIDIHESFMSRALELAVRGRGHVSPNPMVGCILVKDGEIIGEGFHEKYGGPHAEVMAIRNAHKDPLDSIAYINLEPCCVEGKTPPCIFALKDSGVSEVYIGMLDPNPKVNGKGVDALRNLGISTHVGILEDEAIKINQGFIKWVTLGVPYVILKVAQSSNGYMGVNSETSVWITNENSKMHCHKLRSEVDAVLIGRNTALIDDPSLTVREINGINPQRVILDTNRTLPLSLKIFNDKEAENIVLCSSSKFEPSSTHFCKYIPVKEDGNFLSPLHVLKALSKSGITSVLIEGGKKVLESFMDNDLVDKIYLYTSSDILEGARLENPVDITSEWVVVERDNLGGDKLIVAEKEVGCLQEL